MKYDADDQQKVSVQVTFWAERDGSIRLVVPGFEHPAIIKDDPMRPSGHPKLFKFLASHLRLAKVLSD